MSVKFAPGSKPSAQQRNNSWTSLPLRQPSSVPPKRQVSGASTSSSVQHDTAYGGVEDPERQPLIPAAELNRNRSFYPVVVGVVVAIIFGLFVGFGGWRLGQGTGGGRWPGGPQ